VKGWRVEINRRSPKPAKGLSRRLMLAGLAVLPAATLPAAAAEPDPIFALLEAKRAADVVHGEAIDVVDEFECARFEGRNYSSDAFWDADEKCEESCHFAMDVAWQLARTVSDDTCGCGRRPALRKPI
jgi:hypothetical protein